MLFGVTVLLYFKLYCSCFILDFGFWPLVKFGIIIASHMNILRIVFVFFPVCIRRLPELSLELYLSCHSEHFDVYLILFDVVFRNLLVLLSYRVLSIYYLFMSWWNLYLTIIEWGWTRYEELSSPKFAVINRSRRLRLIMANWGLDNSSYCVKTEFNNCFIIYLKNSKQKVVHLFARVYQPIKN